MDSIGFDPQALHQVDALYHRQGAQRLDHKPPQPGGPKGAGDTVTISPEARALLESKMQEYGAKGPQDLSPEEMRDLKQTMAESEQVTAADRAALEAKAGEHGQAPPPAGGPEKGKDGPPPAGGPGGKGGPPPGGGPGKGGKGGQAGGASGTKEDTIEDLEQDIEEVEEEIEELRPKAADDPEKQKELRSKMTELLLLETALSLLEGQEQQI